MSCLSLHQSPEATWKSSHVPEVPCSAGLSRPWKPSSCCDCSDIISEHATGCSSWRTMMHLAQYDHVRFCFVPAGSQSGTKQGVHLTCSAARLSSWQKPSAWLSSFLDLKVVSKNQPSNNHQISPSFTSRTVHQCLKQLCACRQPIQDESGTLFNMQCSKPQQLAEAKRLAKQLLQGWRNLSGQEIQVCLRCVTFCSIRSPANLVF